MHVSGLGGEILETMWNWQSKLKRCKSGNMPSCLHLEREQLHVSADCDDCAKPISSLLQNVLSNCPTGAMKCKDWATVQLSSMQSEAVYSRLLWQSVMAICFFRVCSFVCLFGSHPETTTAEATEAEVGAIVKCFFCSCYTLSVNCSDGSPLLSTKGLLRPS